MAIQAQTIWHFFLEKSNFRMEEPDRFGQDQFSNSLWYHSLVYAKAQRDPWAVEKICSQLKVSDHEVENLKMTKFC